MYAIRSYYVADHHPVPVSAEPRFDLMDQVDGNEGQFPRLEHPVAELIADPVHTHETERAARCCKEQGEYDASGSDGNERTGKP